MRAKQRVWSAVVVIVAVLTSCADMKALSSLMASVQAEFKMTPDLNINNGEDLTVTFARISVDALKLDGAGEDAFARRVASFAKHHYAHASSLRHITVTTIGPSSTPGARASAPHVFDATSLP